METDVIVVAFVEFEIYDDERFQHLTVAFNAIRDAKQSDQWRSDNEWLAYFDRGAQAHFWWPTQAELEEWERRWFSTPVQKRSSDPSLVTPWDFGSMIQAFRDGEYDLLTCERMTHRVGRLYFTPYSWPFGGTDCMHQLVESFGHKVVATPNAS